MRRALTLSLLLAGVATLSAHHTANVTILQARDAAGLVSELDWKQPHVIIHLDVRADGISSLGCRSAATYSSLRQPAA
jgi:hypothetical protein